MNRLPSDHKITDNDDILFIIQRYCQGKKTPINARILATKTNMSKKEAREKLGELSVNGKLYPKNKHKGRWYYLEDEYLKTYGGVRRGRARKNYEG